MGSHDAFSPPPLTRASQNGVAGVNPSHGVSAVNPSINQYENCLRCHGASAGKVDNPVFGYLSARAVTAGDFLNVIPQFAYTSSRHASSQQRPAAAELAGQHAESRRRHPGPQHGNTNPLHGTISGERLVNFDVNVVTLNGVVSYSRAANSCTLICHNHAHSATLGATTTIKKYVPRSREFEM